MNEICMHNKRLSLPVHCTVMGGAGRPWCVGMLPCKLQSSMPGSMLTLRCMHIFVWNGLQQEKKKKKKKSAGTTRHLPP
jgi:hypothetical protein